MLNWLFSGSWKMLPFEGLSEWAKAFDCSYEAILEMLPKFAIMQACKCLLGYLIAWTYLAVFCYLYGRSSEKRAESAKKYLLGMTVLLIVAWLLPLIISPELYALEYFR